MNVCESAGWHLEFGCWLEELARTGSQHTSSTAPFCLCFFSFSAWLFPWSSTCHTRSCRWHRAHFKSGSDERGLLSLCSRHISLGGEQEKTHRNTLKNVNLCYRFKVGSGPFRNKCHTHCRSKRSKLGADQTYRAVPASIHQVVRRRRPCQALH